MPTNEQNHSRTNNKKQTKENKFSRIFADMFIENLTRMKDSAWKKGWVGANGKIEGLPQNISGHPYNGINSFLLNFNTYVSKYKSPVYMTFNQIRDLNNSLEKKINKFREETEKKGEKYIIPDELKKQFVHVKAGEKSNPVIFFQPYYRDKVTGNKVDDDTLQNMSTEERARLSYHSILKSYHVFNIDQTNLEEAHPQLYQKIISNFKSEESQDTEGMYENKALDKMFKEQKWLCKIRYDKPSDNAYYSVKGDLVVVPMKSQFKISKDEDGIYKDGQEFYSSALHEMAHSTSSKERLNRETGKRFGDPKYAKEELVAELTSALVGSTMGFDKRINDNNTSYVENWLETLKKDPSFILTVMSDVNKASKMILKEVDKQRKELGLTPYLEGNLQNIDEEIKINESNDVRTSISENEAIPVDAINQKNKDDSADDDPEEQSLQEDSDIQTNIVSIAENLIREYHLPKEEAEKMAKQIVDTKKDKVTEEKIKADAARASLQKQQEQSRQEEQHLQKEEDEAYNKTIKKEEENSADKARPLDAAFSATLLIGALEAAKNTKGVWMNKDSKANAEFRNSKTPITPYNSIIMNLSSDKNAYSTNVYTYYNGAQENREPVKANKQAIPFSWTDWDYQEIGGKNIISKDNYEKLSATEKRYYNKHATHSVQSIFNIDQTTLSSRKSEIYLKILSDRGKKGDLFTGNSKTDNYTIFQSVKKPLITGKHPDTLVLLKAGDFFESYDDDAKKISDALGILLTKDQQGHPTASFSHTAIDDYLPKIIKSGHKVAFTDKNEFITDNNKLPNARDILDKAYSDARNIARNADFIYERDMKPHHTIYDAAEDKLVISGISNIKTGSKQADAILKANSIYRGIAAAIDSKDRLDLSGRNHLLPEDDSRYERLVQELSAGVMMAKQGLPATILKENQKLIPYWQTEIKENPKTMSIIERDVNNTVESMGKHLERKEVNYQTITKELPIKINFEANQYSLSTDLSQLPGIESNEFVIVKDKASADVILPSEASVEPGHENSGIHKDRITAALQNEGISNIKFYNAKGSLGLIQPNEYFKNKEVSLNRLSRYKIIQHKIIDVSEQANQAITDIESITGVRNDKGQWAFHIKAKQEPSFSIIPERQDLDLFFRSLKTVDASKVKNILARKYYSYASEHPEAKQDFVMPKVSKLDTTKIIHAVITRDKDNKPYIQAIVNGHTMKESISDGQWKKMWLADNMQDYKNAVAAVVFTPRLLNKDEKEREAIKDSPKEEPQLSESHIQSMHTHKI